MLLLTLPMGKILFETLLGAQAKLNQTEWAPKASSQETSKEDTAIQEAPKDNAVAPEAPKEDTAAQEAANDNAAAQRASMEGIDMKRSTWLSIVASVTMALAELDPTGK